MTARKVVVLPAPLRPTRQTSSPAPTSKLTPRRISLLWISTSSPATSSTASQLSDHGRHDVRARADRLRAAVGKYFSLVHGDDAARIAKHDVHVVLDLDDRPDPGLLRRTHQHLHDGRLLGGAHAARRPVGEKDFGL